MFKRKTLSAIFAGLCALSISAPVNENRIDLDYVPDVRDKSFSIEKRGLPDKARSLTSEESYLLTSVFGPDKLDYDLIVLHYKRNRQPRQYYHEDINGRTVITITGEDTPEKVIRAYTHKWLEDENLTEGELVYSPYAESPEIEPVIIDFNRVSQAKIVTDFTMRFLGGNHEIIHGGEYSFHRLGANEKFERCVNQDPELNRLTRSLFPNVWQELSRLERLNLRRLTEEEKAFAKMFFEDDVSTAFLKIKNHPRSCTSRLAHVNLSERDRVHFWGERMNSENYLDPKTDIKKFSTFVHEMVHIMQVQTNFKYGTSDDLENIKRFYFYEIDPENFKFDNYGLEQQAAMLEDYTTYFLTPAKTVTYLAHDIIEIEKEDVDENESTTPPKASDPKPSKKKFDIEWATEEDIENLRIHIESQFPHLALIRIYFELNGKLPLNGEHYERLTQQCPAPGLS